MEASGGGWLQHGSGRSRRIVLTAEDRYASLTAVRSLTAAGDIVYVAAPNPKTYAVRSRWSAGTVPVPDPSEAPGAFVDALVAAVNELNIEVVLPGGEPALLALAEREYAFPSQVTLGIADRGVIERAIDKASLLSLGRKVGLATAQSFVGGRDAVLQRRDELAYPVMVKPLRSETPVGGGRLEYVMARRVGSPDELAARLERSPGDRWLVEEHVPGQLGAVSGVAWQGQLVCAVHQVASRTYPSDGPSAYATTIARDVDLERKVALLLREIGWSGVFQVQFIYSSDAKYLIDFNARIYGSLALAVAAGYNLPALWVDLLVGETPHVGEYRVGVRYRAEERDARALAAALRRVDLLTAARILLPHRDTAHTILSLRDPLPILTTFGKIGDVLRGRTATSSQEAR